MRASLVTLGLLLGLATPAGAQCYGSNPYSGGGYFQTPYGYNYNAFPTVQYGGYPAPRLHFAASLNLFPRLNGQHGYYPAAAGGAGGPWQGPPVQYGLPYYGNGGASIQALPPGATYCPTCPGGWKYGP